MAQGTVMPAPKFTGFNNSGVVVSSGKLYTYSAGTSTPLATYSDVDLTVANANPVILDSAGRATVFLTASSYKFVLKDSSDNTLWTQDNVKAAAPFSVNLDITATFGVTVTAGQGVYLSNGSGSLTAGRWYLWDADLDYASNSALGLPIIGIVTADASAGDVGSVRVLGRADVTGPLTVGTSYYISGTAGALSSSAGTYSRLVGVADSTTSLAMTATSAPVPLASISGLGTNVATWLATPSSSNLAAAVTGETGSGALVFATSPTLVTPALGTPASGTLTNCTGLPAASVVAGTFGSGNFVFQGNVTIPAASILYLDGGSDTYVREASANWMEFTVGGDQMLQLRKGIGVYINTEDVYMGATKKLYLDGGGDTYLYEPSGNAIAAVTGGSERLRIDSSGLVGIGTTSPGVNLDVQASSGSPTIRVGRSSGATTAVQADPTSGYVGTTSNHPLSLVTNNTQKLTIDTSGAVGIGTTSPSYKLHIKEAGTVNGLFIGDGQAYEMYSIMGVNTASSYFKIQANQGGVGAKSIALQPDGGNVGIGTTSPGAKLQIDADPSTDLGLLLKSTGSGSGTQARFYSTSSIVGSITVTTSATSYNTSSDFRLKENIVPTAQGLETLSKINVRDFNFISDPDKSKIQGFIAQDLYNVYPSAVSVGGDDPTKNPWSVDYGRLTPLLVKSIQDLNDKTNALINAVKELHAELQDTKTRLAALEG